MAAAQSDSSSLPSLPPPLPKSPPKYPDLYGKRREMAEVLKLEREISFLEEELKSTEGLQPVSRCCKDFADYVVANSDPLIPVSRKNRKPCRFWKWICGMPCLNFSWVCCFCWSPGVSLQVEMPRCCKNCLSQSSNCGNCCISECQCCSCRRFSCYKEISCCCLEFKDCCCCCRCIQSCAKCSKVCFSNCTKAFCNPCCCLFV